MSTSPSTMKGLTFRQMTEHEELAHLKVQVDRLAKFIVENIPGEPSKSEGAVDCAIRLLSKHCHVYSVPYSEPKVEEWKRLIRMREENERLRSELDNAANNFATLKAERDALRVENEKLKAQVLQLEEHDNIHCRDAHEVHTHLAAHEAGEGK